MFAFPNILSVDKAIRAVFEASQPDPDTRNVPKIQSIFKYASPQKVVPNITTISLHDSIINVVFCGSSGKKPG
jgi:hypothetical protein